jgi:Ribosomal protein L11 methylase
LTADILKNLAVTIPNYMDKGSIIMMSGILNSRKQEVIALYNSIGYKLISENSKAEWTALIMEKIYG